MTTRREFLEGSLYMASAFTPSYVASGFSRTNAAQVRLKPDTTPAGVKALVFDVFGTVVDWRSSVALEVQQLAKRKGVTVDAEKFADAWRAGYGPSMNRVRTGELPWTKLDALHRMTLDRILVDFKLPMLSEEEKNALNHAWHRLRPWPDSVAGLTKLKKKFIIAPLSNGNIALMTDLAKHSGLPWDCILGAELVRHYKPDHEVYQSAADFLNLTPGDVMMVAAHLGDLRAAKAVGLKTAFVPRPLEYGPAGKPDLKGDASVDVEAKDFNDLAARLG
jgi:2-haloacid dehalogenase